MEERKKYQYGEQELDLKDYIENLSYNVNNYLDSQSWNEGQKEEFRKAYKDFIAALKQDIDSPNRRFYSDEFGTIYDIKGEFKNTTDEDTYYNRKGESINNTAFNQLSKRKQKKYIGFDPYAYLSNFSKSVAQEMLKHNKTNITDFNLNDHGFVTYWRNQVAPGQSKVNLQMYLDMDPLVDGQRDTKNRRQYLSSQLDNYKNYLLKNNFNYTNTTFKNRDNLIKLIEKFKTELSNNTFNHLDVQAASALGIPIDFYNAFFSNKDQYRTEEEQKKYEEQLKAETRKKNIENWVKSYYDPYLSANIKYKDKNNPFKIGTLKFFNQDGTFNFNDFENFRINELGINDENPADVSQKLQNKINAFIQNPFTVDQFNYLSENDENYDREILSYIIGGGAASEIESGDYKGWYYIPNSQNPDNHSVLVYNPETGVLLQPFIGDVPEIWEKLKSEQDFGDISNKYSKYLFNKQGGVLSKLQSGGNVFVDYEALRRKSIEEDASKKGVSYKEQEASIRRPGTIVDNTFSGTDWARLGAIGLDVVSMLSAFIPGIGTAASVGTGLSSSFVNFGADITEDGFQWSDLGNLATGIGLDLLGAVPGGGAASKVAKITKGLVVYVPAIIGMLSTLSNTGNIIESYSKILKEDESLTVQDWRNIAEGIGLITGTTGAIKRKAIKETKKNRDNYEGTIAVDLIDKNNRKQTTIFSGEDAKKIKDNANNPNEIQKVLNKYSEFQGWTPASKVDKKTQFFNDEGKFDFKFRAPSKKLNIYENIYDYEGSTYVNRKPYIGATVKVTGPTTRTDITTVNDQYVKNLLQPLEVASKKLEGRLSRKDRKLEELKTQKENLNAELKNITDYKTELAGLTDAKKGKKSLSTLQSELENVEIAIKAQQAVLKNIPNARKNKKQQELNAIIITDANTELKKLIEQKSRLEIAIKQRKQYDRKVELQKKINGDQRPKSVLQGEQAIADKLKRIEKIESLWQQTPTKTEQRLKFERNYPVDADGNITFINPANGATVVKKYDELFSGIKYRKGGSIKKFQAGAIIQDPKKLSYITDLSKILRKEIESNTLENNNPFTGDIKIETSPIETDLGEAVVTAEGLHTSAMKGVDEKKEYKRQKTYPWLNKALQDPILLFDLPLYLKANQLNDKITDLKIASEKPILNLPYQEDLNHFVNSLEYDILGNKTMAQYNNLANQAFTSDSREMLAHQYENQLAGLNAQNSLKHQSNLAILEDIKNNINTLNKNKQRAIEAANSNVKAGLTTQNNISTHLQDHYNKDFTNFSEYIGKLNSQFTTELSKNEKLQEATFKYDTKNNIIQDMIAGRHSGLSQEQVNLLTRRQNGEKLFTESELSLLEEIDTIIETELNNRWLDYRNILRYGDDSVQKKSNLYKAKIKTYE